MTKQRHQPYNGRRNNNYLSVFVLLDASGSMTGDKWKNGLEAINKYVSVLQESRMHGNVTVSTFSDWSEGPYSHNTQFNPAPFTPNLNMNNMYIPNGYIPRTPFYPNSIQGVGGQVPVLKYNQVRTSAIEDFSRINMADVSAPNGGTSLYDATARVLDIAEHRKSEKTVIVIVTDGEENASRTTTLEMVKARIDNCKERGWEVVFLGAEFNPERITHSYGLGTDKSFHTSAYNLNSAMHQYATASMNYATRGIAISTANFTDGGVVGTDNDLASRKASPHVGVTTSG